MRALVISFIIFNVLGNAPADPACQTITPELTSTMKFWCTELTTLEKLVEAQTNTTDIQITDSTIPNLRGHAFARFGATLVTLDLHQSGIETIEPQAFIGLTRLEKLILWGNKLKWVPGDWFANTYNLRTLDLSFNSIQGIDYTVFTVLPYLQYFYLDYNQLNFIDFNMFANLRYLKEVKFAKNPLSWPYRARLTWQLENQQVHFTEEWENWEWMNAMIKECIESGQGELPKDTVLDCVTGKFLDFVHEISDEEIKREIPACHKEAQSQALCMKAADEAAVTKSGVVRRILQDYAAILPPMLRSLSPFPGQVNS